MENKPLISIIIPVYNVEKYLHQSIESIICQNFNDYEIILINDGSTDQSASICDSYCVNHKNVKVIHKINEGVGIARNEGVSNAKGTYIYFLDSDDYVETNFFEIIVPLTKLNHDIIQFGFNRVNNEGTYLNTTKPFGISSKNIQNDKSVLAKIFQTGCGLSLWDKLIKRELIENNQIIFDNKRRGQDFTFIIKVCHVTSSIIAVNQSLLNYRMVFNAKQKTDDAIVENHIENFEKLYRLMTNGKNKDENFFLIDIYAKWFLFVIPIHLSNYKNMDDNVKKKKIGLILSNPTLKEFTNKNKYLNFQVAYHLQLNYIFLTLKMFSAYLFFGSLFSFYRKKKYN